jgi:hypothetical protein
MWKSANPLMHLENNLKSKQILEKTFFGVVAPQLWQ